MIEGRMKNPESCLPPGFRFHPTDEELILHYLRNKATSLPCPVSIIAEVDLYKFDPWDLPAKASFGEKEWYFFSPRDRKYPNGARPNRSAASGYWKATGTDKPIVGTDAGGMNSKESIGVKKALVFYQGRPPKGLKTNWIMHEYRLAQTPQRSMKLRDTSMRLDEWVLCRIYKKNSTHSTTASDREEEEDPSLEDVSFGRAPNRFMNQSSSLQVQKSSSFSDLLAAADFSILSRLLYDNPLSDSAGPAEPSPNFGHESFNQLVTNTTHHNINNNNNNNNNDNRYVESAQETGRQNQLKRERPAAATSEEDCVLHPSKKFNNPFIYSSFNDHSEATLHHLLNQPSPFFNQQLPLSSNLQF